MEWYFDIFNKNNVSKGLLIHWCVGDMPTPANLQISYERVVTSRRSCLLLLLNHLRLMTKNTRELNLKYNATWLQSPTSWWMRKLVMRIARRSALTACAGQISVGPIKQSAAETQQTCALGRDQLVIWSNGQYYWPKLAAKDLCVFSKWVIGPKTRWSNYDQRDS